MDDPITLPRAFYEQLVDKYGALEQAHVEALQEAVSYRLVAVEAIGALQTEKKRADSVTERLRQAMGMPADDEGRQ